jgi:hypothetical protein
LHWEKSAPDLVDQFARVMDRFPDVERRKMFGYPAAFIGGNMITGLHGANWVVRLPEDAQAEAMAGGASVFEPMAGRPMKNFVALPPPVLEDDDEIARWVGRAVEHGRTLPPKKK